MTSILFSPTRLGSIELQNRIVMAPMTRCRALGNLPQDLMATHYAQRAEAGLIVTEGTSPSPNGVGYARIPGIYSQEQVVGWRKITKAVHKRGGKIFVQLMHVGRIGHPENLPKGAELLGPSPEAAAGEMWTDATGMQPLPAPRPMNEADIRQVENEFLQAALNAREADFDGVELHAANGYLLEQFLSPTVNRRADAWGGSLENRARLLLDITQAVAKAIGPDRVGVRLSPHGVFNDIPAYPDVEADYAWLATKLSALNLAYLHLVDHSAMGAPPVPETTKTAIRKAFPGTLILSGGYDRARAEADLEASRGNLVAFGRPFIANPDLVERLRNGVSLENPDPATFYTAEAKGYTDYPVQVPSFTGT